MMLQFFEIFFFPTLSFDLIIEDKESWLGIHILLFNPFMIQQLQKENEKIT